MSSIQHPVTSVPSTATVPVPQVPRRSRLEVWLTGRPPAVLITLAVVAGLVGHAVWAVLGFVVARVVLG